MRFEYIRAKKLHDPSVTVISFHDGIFLILCFTPIVMTYDERKSSNFVPDSPLILFITRISLPAGEMNGFNQVELTLQNILQAINPSNEDWAVRFHIINEVRAVVGSVESLRGLLCFATILLYFMYHLQSSTTITSHV